jgi:hypothetical protein
MKKTGCPGPLIVGDAALHAGTDEGEVGVGVGRFDATLFVGEFGPLVHFVVTVPSVLGEHGLVAPEVRRDAIDPVPEPGRGGGIDESGGGVVGTVHGPGEGGQHVSVGLAQPLRHVDDVET